MLAGASFERRKHLSTGAKAGGEALAGSPSFNSDRRPPRKSHYCTSPVTLLQFRPCEASATDGPIAVDRGGERVLCRRSISRRRRPQSLSSTVRLRWRCDRLSRDGTPRPLHSNAAPVARATAPLMPPAPQVLHSVESPYPSAPPHERPARYPNFARTRQLISRP